MDAVPVQSKVQHGIGVHKQKQIYSAICLGIKLITNNERITKGFNSNITAKNKKKLKKLLWHNLQYRQARETKHRTGSAPVENPTNVQNGQRKYSWCSK